MKKTVYGELSPVQTTLYYLIAGYSQRNGIPPTFRELASLTGKGFSTVETHLSAMRMKGYVDWRPKSRSLWLLK